MPQTPSFHELALICGELDEEIRDLVAAQASGEITVRTFVAALLSFENARASIHGLVLTASHTYDDWTVVCLRLAGRSEPCASYEFHPSTGRFRDVGTPCRPADALGSQRVEET